MSVFLSRLTFAIFLLIVGVSVLSRNPTRGGKDGAQQDDKKQGAGQHEVQEYWNELFQKLTDSNPADSVIQFPCSFSNRFIGFVECSLKLRVPSAWVECFTNAKISTHGQPERFKIGRLVMVPTDVEELWVRQFEGSWVGDQLRLGNGDAAILVPVRFVNSNKYVPTSAIIDGEYVVLALVERDEPRARLVCFSSNTEELVWQMEMTDYISSWYRGSTDWFLQLVIREDGDAVLFHACDLGVLIEEFDIKTGDKKVVFNSVITDKREKVLGNVN